MARHAIRSRKPYVGNRKTREVHKTSCSWAQQIKPGNRVFFNLLKQAKQLGKEQRNSGDATHDSSRGSPK